jgi:hypothetical protein
MVRDRHEDLTDVVPPRTLRQPADAAPPIGHVADVPALQTFRAVWAGRTAAPVASMRSSLRAWAGRVSGRTDRHLLFALARATDALATQCDLLGDRLAAQGAVTADLGDALGGDLTQLRAEVLQLRRLVAGQAHPPDG